MTLPLILVAEGQQDVRHEVRESLEQSGFRALPVASAADIWKAMDTMAVGALVLDTSMRGPDGMDLCRDVRERSDVPIILVGARSTEVDRVVGLELGADDYLAKPYSTRELAARLRAVLRRGRSERAGDLGRRATIRFDGWCVDLARREVRDPADAPVDVTAAEFSLLVLLLEQPQRVIARARLIEMAGMRNAPSSERSVDVLVSRLRRKLTHAGRAVPIITVRGAGYMFGAAVERG